MVASDRKIHLRQEVAVTDLSDNCKKMHQLVLNIFLLEGVHVEGWLRIPLPGQKDAKAPQKKVKESSHTFCHKVLPVIMRRRVMLTAVASSILIF